jgi:transposase
MSNLYHVPGCHVERVRRDSDATTLVARAATTDARCPGCATRSQAVHSTYVRRPADLPALGRAVRLAVRVRRFYCRVPTCRRHTFAERVPGLLDVRARRTRRLAAAQRALAVETGAEPGARLAAHLAMPASADTLLRLVRRAPLPRVGPAHALGVDDWALRKGRTYGTILVDLEARRVVDLLPDRTADTLAAWLRRRPPVALITRDRSPEYARAATAAAPQAVQVADRWHLLLNVRQMTERYLAGVYGRLRQLPAVPGTPADTQAPTRRPAAFRRTRPEVAVSAAHRARWRAVYDEVRRRHAAGESLPQITRALGVALGTSRRFARAATFPERAKPAPRPSILDPYLAYLRARHGDGCENARQLWRELRARGYPGGAQQVHRWLRERRRVPAPKYPGTRQAAVAAHAATRRPTRPTLPSPRQLAWLAGQAPEALRGAEASALAQIAQDPEAAGVIALVRRFVALVRERPLDAATVFDAWLADARASGVRTVQTFAVGLELDGAAVRAALTTPWSNAQSEGHVTKLKLLKRQMYGRANFDLLRRRVLLAA